MSRRAQHNCDEAHWNDRDYYLCVIDRYREGIRRHMEARANDPDVRESDRRLWALLAKGEQERIPDRDDT